MDDSPLYDSMLCTARDVAKEFAAEKGARARVVEYHMGDYRVQVEWDAGGLRRRIDMTSVPGGKGVEVGAYAATFVPSAAMLLRLLAFLVLLGLLLWTIIVWGSRPAAGWWRAPAGLALLLLCLHFLKRGIAGYAGEDTIWRSHRVGTLPVERTPNPTALQELLSEAWEVAAAWAADEVTREYRAAQRHLHLEILPRLRRVAREHGTSLDRVASWQFHLDWPLRGPQGRLWVKTTPNEEIVIAANAGRSDGPVQHRHFGPHRISFGDMQRFEQTLAEAVRWVERPDG